MPLPCFGNPPTLSCLPLSDLLAWNQRKVRLTMSFFHVCVSTGCFCSYSDRRVWLWLYRQEQGGVVGEFLLCSCIKQLMQLLCRKILRSLLGEGLKKYHCLVSMPVQEAVMVPAETWHAMRHDFVHPWITCLSRDVRVQWLGCD